MACGAPGIQAAANAPTALAGAWQRAQGEAHYYLLLTADGEFRMAEDPALLFDDPLMLGRYRYEAGRLTFINGTVADAACRAEGVYVVTAYEPDGGPRMTLAQAEDACAIRQQMFHNTQWARSAADG